MLITSVRSINKWSKFLGLFPREMHFPLKGNNGTLFTYFHRILTFLCREKINNNNNKPKNYEQMRKKKFRHKKYNIFIIFFNNCIFLKICLKFVASPILK